MGVFCLSTRDQEVLKEKVIWPWPKRTDENYEDRIALLKERGNFPVKHTVESV